MGSNYQKQFQKDYENLFYEVGDLKKLIKNLTSIGNELKAIAMLLVHRVSASMDQTVDFIKLITEGVFDFTKGTIANWSNSLCAKLDGFIGEIFQGLHNSVYVHTDESPININGKNHQLYSYSNDKYTLQYVHESKCKEAIEELGFLPEYLGTLIHDQSFYTINLALLLHHLFYPIQYNL